MFVFYHVNIRVFTWCYSSKDAQGLFVSPAVNTSDLRLIFLIYLLVLLWSVGVGWGHGHLICCSPIAWPVSWVGTGVENRVPMTDKDVTLFCQTFSH